MKYNTVLYMYLDMSVEYFNYIGNIVMLNVGMYHNKKRKEWNQILQIILYTNST